MSLTSPRRDQRRRLLVAWNRSPEEASPAVSEQAPHGSSSMTDEAPSPIGLAAVVPVGWVRFACAVLACVAPAAASATLAVWETATGRPFAAAEGRFATAMHMLRTAFDPSSTVVVSDWIAHASLGVAAAFALALRSLERRRRDDYVGRYRAWGWLAGLLVLASFAAAAPLGPVISAALGDATGMRPGPDGMGWWVAIAATALVATTLWAVLPLRERSTTVVWCAAAALVWGAAASGSWLTAAGTVVSTHQSLATRVAWWAGCSLALVSMLAATRAVLREARGLVAPRQSRAERRSRPAAQASASRGTDAQATARSQRPVVRPAPEPLPANPRQEGGGDSEDEPSITAVNELMVTADEEDDEADMRHLSKSERKRLRKLRKQRAAA